MTCTRCFLSPLPSRLLCQKLRYRSVPMAGQVQDMGQYETVFVGFPIWWYQAPRIIETFLESYDFSGKKVVPFATSGGSGLGKTEDILKAVCPAAQWLPGKRLRSGESAGAVQSWVDKLDI